MIGVLRQAFQLQGQAASQQQQGVKATRPLWLSEQATQQRQQRITRLKPPAQFSNGLSAMPRPRALQQHSATGQMQTARSQFSPQRLIRPAVANLEVGHTPHQLTAQGEVAAERAAAVVHEHQGHCAILTIAAPLP